MNNLISTGCTAKRTDFHITFTLQLLPHVSSFTHSFSILSKSHLTSNMSHPRCVCINNRFRYQSVTQQYLKRCLIQDDNYMFRPIAAIIRFSSESMVVVLYGIGIVMSRWWDVNICDVCYMLLLWDTGGDLWCALSWGVQGAASSL